MTQAAKVDISVVAPVYNEEESLPHLLEAVSKVMDASPWTWEILCIDDGSKDKSAQVLEELSAKYKALRPILLRRNSGQTAAMQAGFDHSTGDVVITMDADLQNDPTDIPKLIEHMQKTDADIVSGWRKDRKDNKWKNNIPSQIGNKLIGRVTGVKLHDFGCSLKAYRREVLDEVRIYGELHRFIPAVVSQYGAKVEEVVVKHHARQFGQSKYGLDKTFRVLLDLLLVKFILRYINRPIHAFGMGGLISLGMGGLICTYLTLLKLGGSDIGGRPLLILGVMLIILGVQMIGMGVLGEVMMRIYHEPQGRKQYVLKLPPMTLAKAEKVVKKPTAKKTAAKKPAAKKKTA
ncbi:MAG: glycosyltransferase family 2 protein [Pseudomonadota bacterium]|nr:glycosyltransferase family 2 protein [Pseudomonadota bacterium]